MNHHVHPRPAAHRVAFLGFSDFERSALATVFRLAGERTPPYAQAPALTQADFLLADADHAPSVHLVLMTDRLADTVFIGKRAPEGALVWMARPIDALHVVRELDAMVAARGVPVSVSGGAGVEPAEVAPGAAAATAIAAEPQPSTPILARALIVDDSEVAQRFLQTRLQPWGLSVDRAGSSGQAIDLMQQHHYEFVFVDLELGPASALDGLALCQHIKRSASAVDALVIIVSAHHSEMDRVRGALAGCDGYLAKPLEPAALQRLLLRQGLKAPTAEPAPAA